MSKDKKQSSIKNKDKEELDINGLCPLFWY